MGQCRRVLLLLLRMVGGAEDGCGNVCVIREYYLLLTLTSSDGLGNPPLFRFIFFAFHCRSPGLCAMHVALSFSNIFVHEFSGECRMGEYPRQDRSRSKFEGTYATFPIQCRFCVTLHELPVREWAG